ncbi:MAG: PAS domain S-box protein, partial [Deferribacteres bacterium]|nr:PAS domain S-box protein [Deferribacteres bacterium]
MMSLILISSVIILLAAMGLSVVILRCTGDWRIGFLTAMLGLTALRQSLGRVVDNESMAVSFSGTTTEIPELLLSITAFLAVFFLNRIITGQKRVDEVLQESKEKLQRITNSALDAIVMVDNTGKVAYWNPAAEKMFGYSAGEILGEYMYKRLSPARYHEKIIRGFEKFKDTGRGPVVGNVFEVECLRRDGEEFPAEISVSEMDVKGRWWAVAIIKDITERRQAENHIQHLQSV